MSINNAFRLIEDNLDDADFCGPIEADKIKAAEKILGIVFPKSYFNFLLKYGSGDIAGIEFFGIIEDPAIDRKTLPNGIWLTLNLRKELAMPKEFVVVSETGYGPYYVIDTSLKDDSFESPVYIWDIGNQKEKIFSSFGEFLFSILKESL